MLVSAEFDSVGKQTSCSCHAGPFEDPHVSLLLIKCENVEVDHSLFPVLIYEFSMCDIYPSKATDEDRILSMTICEELFYSPYVS